MSLPKENNSHQLVLIKDKWMFMSSYSKYSAALMLKQVRRRMQQPKGNQRWGWVEKTLVRAICLLFSPVPEVMAA